MKTYMAKGETVERNGMLLMQTEWFWVVWHRRLPRYFAESISRYIHRTLIQVTMSS